jgi:hypothetical protein
MKPYHYCVNHPAEEAISVCHQCNNWFCSHCLKEGSKGYFCNRPECLQAFETAKSLHQSDCSSYSEKIISGAVKRDSGEMNKKGGVKKVLSAQINLLISLLISVFVFNGFPEINVKNKGFIILIIFISVPILNRVITTKIISFFKESKQSL